MYAPGSSKQNFFYAILFNPDRLFNNLSRLKNDHLFVLLVIAAFWSVSMRTFTYSSHTYLWSSFITNTLLVIAIGWACFYVYAALIWLIAKAFGGQGTVKETYKVWVSAFAPGLFAVILYGLAVFIWGDEIIRSHSATGSLAIARAALLFVYGLASVWFLWILFKGLIHAHRLSSVKAGLVIAVFCSLMVGLPYLMVFLIN